MFLADDLITSVKRRCNVPTAQVTFQANDFLALGDEEIRSKLVPLVLKHMEEYYVTHLDQNVVINQAAYPIPYRAIGMALRDVEMVSSTDLDTRVGLERLNREDLYAGISGNARFLVKKNGFYIEGNNLILYPTPQQQIDILRMSYYLRPSQLVPAASCAQVSAINLGAKQLTVSVLPSTITTSTTVDFVKANPGFDCTAIDQTISNIAGTVLTFSAALPVDGSGNSLVSIGDYVCLSNQSCVVQVPVELQPLLFQYVVIRVLAAQGDINNLNAALKELETLEKAAGLLLAPRVSGRVKRVVNARGINRWV